MAKIDIPNNPTDGQTFTQNGKTWKQVTADTRWVLVPTLAPLPGLTGDAQCRLDKVTNQNKLKLSPYQGNKIVINGNVEEIPSGGVEMTPTSPDTLAVNTDYYVYAFMDSSTMKLEAKTTVPTMNTSSPGVGIQIKTGDATRTLVGMCRLITLNSNPNFEDDPVNRYVISYYNRKRRTAFLRNATALSSTATYSDSATNDGFVSILGPLSYLIWSDEIPVFSLNAQLSGVDHVNWIFLRAMANGIAVDASNAIQHCVLSILSIKGHEHRFQNSSQSSAFWTPSSEGHQKVELFAAKTGSRALKLAGATEHTGPTLSVEFWG